MSNSQFSTDLDKNSANYVQLSPLTFIERAASVYPDRCAVVYGRTRRTWLETYERCRRLASALRQHGIKEDDTVALMLPNVPAMYEAHFAIPMAGAVIHGINIRLDPEAIAFQLKHGDARVLLTDPEFSATISKALKEMDDPPLVIDVADPAVDDGEMIGDIEYEDFIAKGDPEFGWALPEDEWRAIAEVIEARKLLPFVDIAYQGFAQSLADDAFIVRHLADRVPEMIVSSSCSKNFGLYRDRVGTLSLLAADKKAKDVVYSQVNNVVRTIYSVPPDHGAVVVATILNDPDLKVAWRVELAEMRSRLREMRVLLNEALKEKAPGHDFSHLVRARGMFCFLGITEDQVNRLKRDYGVYMVGSSRINTAGITARNVNYLADAIAATL